MLPFWPGQQVGADFGCLFILFCDLLFVWSLSFFDIFGKSASRYSTMVSHCSDWQFFTSFLLIILEISWSRPSHQRKAMVPQYSLLCLRANRCMIRAVACSPNLLSILQMELNLQAHKKVSYLREAWTLCWFEFFTCLGMYK